MLRLATCEAEKTFTKEVQSGPEEVEDCTKVARWIGSLKIKNCEKVWKFEWLQYPTGHLSVCRLRLKKSLVPVADCCQGPLNMWKNLWVWNKNVNLLIPSWDRWEEEFFSHPGRQLKLLLDDGWKCGKCRSIRCGELDCPESLGNFISKEPNIYILKTIHLLRTGKDAGINFPPVKQHFEEIKLLLI